MLLRRDEYSRGHRYAAHGASDGPHKRLSAG
jgi:hypothetical protein